MTEKEYRENWNSKLDGICLGLMQQFMSESEAHEIAIDFIMAIRKVRNLLKDKRVGLQIEVSRAAYATALDLMDELGW